MDKGFEENYFELEKISWWFKGRRNFLRRLKLKKDLKLLEVGCGSGLNLRVLNIKDKKGVELSLDAVNKGKERGLDVVCSDFEKEIIFENGTFDVILALDVIEHLENDKEAIKKLSNLLKEDGKLILTVPAFNFLWSYHDDLNQHKRRYTKKDILKLTKPYFKTKLASYWNFFLFPLVFLVVNKNKLFKKEEENLKRENPFINKVLYSILKFENFILLKGISLPFGVSFFYIGKKRN